MRTLLQNRLFIAALFVALVGFHSGKLWAPMTPTNGLNSTAPSLRECYTRLNSNNLGVSDPRFSRLQAALAEKVSAMLALTQRPAGRFRRSQEPDFLSLRAEYDQIDDVISRNADRWSLSPEAEQTFDDCYVSLHPEAPDVN